MIVEGFHVPDDDNCCHQAALQEVGNLERAFKHVKVFDTVVQAGGNFGIFANALSKRFKAVYTFEPCGLNFKYLAMNCTQPNIIKIQAALGDRPQLIAMMNEANETYNAGARCVGGKGLIPTLCIDDLGLESCDLLCLDIEGRELAALHGAIKTIARFKPIIVIEDKTPCANRYGVKVGETEQWLFEQYGYIVADRYDSDILLI